jgi:O-antigen ligase
MIGKLRRLLPEYGPLALVLAAFLLGGASRADVTSLLVLRPLAVFALALAFLFLPRAVWRENRSLLLCALAWLGLTALQLVPLPPAVWQSLPGRELAVQIDHASGLGDVWRPFSMVPWRTVNSLFALVLPLAVLLWMLILPPASRHRVAYLLLGLVLMTMVLGLLQVIGGPKNAFYLYRITNEDSAVGLFANRNHNAIFIALGFPLLAATLALLPAPAELIRTREWAAAGAAVLLIPFLLTAQSRAGILIGIACIASAVWLYQSPTASAQKRRPRKAIDPRLAFGVIAGAGLIALTMLFTATNAVERLSRLGKSDDELRLKIWPPIADLVGDFMPWGSGIGTFVEVYGTIEPDQLLASEYVNHAHNDWLELTLEGGLPFLALLAIALIVVLRAGLANLRRASSPRDRLLRKLGIVIIFVLALGSTYDYPLRCPSLASLLAIAVVLWAGRPANGIRR